jgi:endonuclease/exonuclease/phosphatase family metal-dependent hydrolase
MRIKTLTWNIGGGKLLDEGSDPTRLASYSKDGLHEIIELLKVENPDVITLQETQKNDTNDQVQTIADALGYSYIHDSTSQSHIDTDSQLGHAILTRYEITDHTRGFFTNPEVEIEWEDGSTATSFDKGYSTCTLDVKGRPLTVTTLHLIPFKRFEIDIPSEQSKTILQDVEAKITGDHSPWLIQGDFNIDSNLLKEYLPRLFDVHTQEILLQEPTTPKDRKYDHIICRSGNILEHRVISNVLTDHYPVVAEIEFMPLR